MTATKYTMGRLADGCLLRFFDHGSGKDRIAHACVLSPDGSEERYISLQLFYRLRKSGAILISHTDEIHDYYKVTT